jgi:hypothetical protein
MAAVAEPLAKPEPAAARRRTLEALQGLARSGSPLAARVRTVRDWAAVRTLPPPAPWSATLPALAALFPAGLPRGELVELSGRRSSGRFGLVTALLAAATAAGENAALVDLGDGLDPQGAVAAGVALSRLLWARPCDLAQALAAAESLLGGGFPLVAVDLGLPPVPGGRGAEASWLRLARAARAAQSLLVVSAPYRVCGVAAPLALVLDHGRVRWQGRGGEPRLLDGLEAALDPAHGRLGGDRTPPSRAELRFAVS